MLSSLPADPHVMCLDLVISNRILATFVISTDSIMLLDCCMMDAGIEVFFTLTFGDTCLVVLPFTHPRSEPHMNSAFLISCTVRE